MYKSGVVFGFIALSLCVLSAYAAEVNFTPCKRSINETAPRSEIHSVKVDPCALAPEGPCSIVRGNNVTIEIQFTPKIKVNKNAKHGYFWTTSLADIPFKGINANPCATFMRCPSKKNVRVTYAGVLPTKANFPAATYPVKIKLTQGKKTLVCIVVKIKLE